MSNFQKTIKKVGRGIWFFFKWFSILLEVALVLLLLHMFITTQYGKVKYDKFRKAQPFNAEIWQKTNIMLEHIEDETGYGDERYNRCYMYSDLIKNCLHLNMLYSEVIKLVGEPKRVEYYTNPELKCIEYQMGGCERGNYSYPGYSYMVQNSSLYLYFDHDLRLVAFSKVSDFVHKIKPIVFGKENSGWIKTSKAITASIKNAKHLFYCKQGECHRYEKRSSNHATTIDWSKCKEKDVERNWGYKLW